MRLLHSLLLVSLLLAAGCHATESHETALAATVTATGTPINVTCPISGEVVTPQGGVVSFRGSTIAFCCADCRIDFEKMDDAAKAATLARAGITLPG